MGFFKNRAIDKAIFLDLDGVLFDTVREAYAICVLAQNRAKSIKEVCFKSKHFKIFAKYRFLIRHAGDYYYLLKLIDKTMKYKGIDVEKEFMQQVKPRTDEHKSFEKSFLEKRKLIRDNHYNHWLSLNRPYDFLHRLFSIVKDKKESIFIITTKDKGSVLKLFSIVNIKFPRENIYGREIYKKFDSKGDIIKYIKKKYRIKKSLFVDDSREHLSTCKGIRGLETVQAGWGYVSKHVTSSREKTILSKIKKVLGG